MWLAYEPLAASGFAGIKKDLTDGFELKKLAKAGREKYQSESATKISGVKTTVCGVQAASVSKTKVLIQERYILVDLVKQSRQTTPLPENLEFWHLCSSYSRSV